MAEKKSDKKSLSDLAALTQEQPAAEAPVAEATEEAAAAPAEEAPAAAPPVPIQVTPPLVPAGTAAPVRRSRGGRRLAPPMEVAQVSAAAAASEAVSIQSAASGGTTWRHASSEASAAAPPLAQTCHPSRRLPFGSSATVMAGGMRETALAETKNVRRMAAPSQPHPVRTAAPTAQAAIAPPELSVRARQAANARMAAKAAARAGAT